MFLHINKQALLTMVLICGIAEGGALTSFDWKLPSMKDFGEYGLTNILPQSIASVDWQKAALPSAGLAATPAVATYLLSKYKKDKIASPWLYGLPSAGTIGLAALLGAYQHNNWLQGALLGAGIGTALNLPAMYYARTKAQNQEIINQQLNTALETKERIKNQYKDKKASSIGEKDNLLRSLATIKQAIPYDTDWPLLKKIVEGSRPAFANKEDAKETLRQFLARNPLWENRAKVALVKESEYEVIRAALVELQAANDGDALVDLFVRYPNRMSNVLHELATRTQLYTDAGIPVARILMGKVKTFMEQAQQKANESSMPRKQALSNQIKLVKTSIDNLLKKSNIQKGDFAAAYREVDRLNVLQQGVGDENMAKEIEQLRKLLASHESAASVERDTQATKQRESLEAMFKLVDSLSQEILAAKTPEEASSVLKKIDDGIAKVNKSTVLTQQEKDDFKRTLMNLVQSKAQELTPLPRRRSRTKSSIFGASLPLSKEAEKEEED